MNVPDGGTPAEAIDAARKAFERVMDTWNGRISTVGAKLEIAWQSAADVIAARVTAAERERCIQLAIDYDAVCWREPPDGDGGDWRPFAGLLAAAPGNTTTAGDNDA